MPKYQFFYPGSESATYSEPECSPEETLEDAIENAESMIKGGTEEIIVMEIDRNYNPVRVVARVAQLITAEVTVY